MPGLLFVSQVALETWAQQGKIEFQGNVMTLVAAEGRGRSYALDPAVLFLKVVNAPTDPNQLIAKVKTDAQLRSLGAERVEDSVVLGDLAYEVQPGFLAEGRAGSPAAASAPEAVAKARASGSEAPATPSEPQAGEARPGPLPRGLEEKRKEAEALARFLLENLS